ncbi:hypothetical protein ABK040_004374 [Willaertia magna]
MERRLKVLANHLQPNIIASDDDNNLLEHHLTNGITSSLVKQNGEHLERISNSIFPLNNKNIKLSEREQSILTNQIINYPNYSTLQNQLREFFTKNIEKFKFFSGYDKSLEECRQTSHDRALTILKQEFVKPLDILNDPMKIQIFLNGLMTDVSTIVKLSVHFNLYAACIAHLGSPQQIEEHLGVNSTFTKELGCFLMSELCHASNVRKLQVTATYDENTKEFIINTPTEGDQKYWIGNAFKSATKGVCFAQLIVGKVNYGIHAFVIPLRDPTTMTVNKGIVIRDVGVKIGLNGIDNGMVAFHNVRIPVNNLLCRYAKINTNENNVTKCYVTNIPNENIRFAKHIGALLQARLGVGSGSICAMQMSLTIAIRYALQRRQFSDNPKNEEWPLMKYHLHQLRLIPHLADTFACLFFSNYCLQKYQQYMMNITKGSNVNDNILKEIHVLASVSKVVISWKSLEVIQEARESCGGQGVLVRNILPIIRVDSESNVTLDGDNHLLLFQIAGALLTNYGKKYTLQKSKNSNVIKSLIEPTVQLAKNLILISKETMNDFWRNGLLQHYANCQRDHLLSKEFILNCLQYREDRLLHTLAKKMKNEIQQQELLNIGNKQKAQYEAHNKCASHSVALAKAYCEKIIIENYFDKLKELELQLGAYSNLYTLLQNLCYIHCLNILVNDGSFYLSKKVFGASKYKAIKKLREELITLVAPSSLQIVNAFDIPDCLLDETIGSRNYNYVDLNGYNHEINDL